MFVVTTVFWVSVRLVSLQDVVGSCPCTSGSIVRTELLDRCTGKPECISIAAHVCSKHRYRRVSPRRHPKTSLEASVCRRRSIVMCTCAKSKHVTQKYIYFSLNNCFFLIHSVHPQGQQLAVSSQIIAPSSLRYCHTICTL